MMEFLLILIAGLLFYKILEERCEKKKSKKDISYKDVLPVLMEKDCEVIVKEPLVGIDVMYSIQGKLVDFDDEWIVVEQQKKKKKVIKVLRIELIGGLKELKD